MVFIEKVKPEEIPAVKAMLKLTWQATYACVFLPKTIEKITKIWHDPEVLKQQVNDPRIYFAAAKNEKGEIVGLITASKEKEDIYLGRLYVHPQHQRQGIGNMLLDSVVNYFPHSRKMRLEVEEKNEIGQLFYFKHGFKESARKVNIMAGEKVKVIVMEKNLSGINTI